MSACGDLSLLTLHEQCTLASTIAGYGSLVTRVDGGWLYHKYMVAPGSVNQIRIGVFVAEEEAPNLYEVADVFDMSLHDEAELSLTLFPAYDLLVKAVANGWEYYTVVKTPSGSQIRNPVFVPRAQHWVEKTYIADGTAALTLVDQTLSTSDTTNKTIVHVGNGAHRTYNASATKTEHYSTTGTTQIDFPTDWAPNSGEFITVKTLEDVSHA